MKTDTCQITTKHAQKYLALLCKQFGQKVSVHNQGHRGRIEFSFGACGMYAGASLLELNLEAADSEALSKLRSVATSYIERFAFREAPMIVWNSSLKSTAQANA